MVIDLISHTYEADTIDATFYVLESCRFLDFFLRLSGLVQETNLVIACESKEG